MVSLSGILSLLPEEEYSFLLETSQTILRKCTTDSLEDLCRKVASTLSNTSYGWEEAILDKTWYRYPSEIRDMTFCSEEALKNYLLLKTVGITPKYCIVEGYRGSGMAHEIILVPDTEIPHSETYLLLDHGSVNSVQINDSEIVYEQGNTVAFSDITFLDEDEILPRVNSLRNGQRFLEAIEVGQMLYRKEITEGELEAYVKYHPESQEIEFTSVLTRYTAGLQLYLSHRSFVLENERGEKEIHDAQVFGVCDHVLYSTTGQVPLLSFLDGRPKLTLSEQLGNFDTLTENDRTTISVEIFYYLLLNSTEEEYVHPEENILEEVEKWRAKVTDDTFNENAKKVLEEYLDIYDHYNTFNYHAARRFFDFQLTSLGFHSKFSTQEEFDEYLLTYRGMNPSLRKVVYLANAWSDFKEVFSSADLLECSNELIKKVAERTAIPHTPCTFSKLFELIDTLGSTTYEQLFGA